MKLDRFRQTDAAPESDYEKDLDKALDKFFTQLLDLLNNGLKFSDNVNCALTSATTHTTPGTEVAVAHTLKRVPVGYLVYRKDKAGSIYDGSTSFSTTNIYIKSDVASVTAYLIIF